jgi:hypothetical protein
MHIYVSIRLLSLKVSLSNQDYLGKLLQVQKNPTAEELHRFIMKKRVTYE